MSAQVLDLTKMYTAEQAEEAKKKDGDFESIEAGGYVCKIVDAILNTEKKYIELDLDIAEGPHAGYFQRLEDRAGFWGLKNFMSYKESVLGKFLKTCTAFNNSNPNYNFNPMQNGGSDVSSLIGKTIGVVIGKEEYKSKAGETRQKDVAVNIIEVSKIREGKFKVPDVKKLEDSTTGKSDDEFMTIDPKSSGELPF